MTSLNDAVLNTLNGAILYDRSILSQVSDEIFLISSWKNSSKISNQYQSGGRGETFIISNNGQEFVLRHYNRGGYLAKFNRDSYFWLGQEKTRPFLEWRLLKKLFDLGLPTPKPVAARYTRRGMFYHSDIITVRIPNIQPLSSILMENDIKNDFWYSLGSTIYRFHRAGVFHADLNCHNIQIDTNGKIWILDFDRGQILAPGTWQKNNLKRLQRSLKKVSKQNLNFKYNDMIWKKIAEGYDSRSS